MTNFLVFPSKHNLAYLLASIESYGIWWRWYYGFSQKVRRFNKHVHFLDSVIHIVKKNNPIAVQKLVEQRVFSWNVHFLIASTLFSLIFFLNLQFLTVFFYSLSSRISLPVSQASNLELKDWLTDVTQCSQFIANGPKVFDIIRFHFFQFFQVCCSLRQLVTYSHHREV